MRVAYLTAGAGGMYCGSCLRDNALAAALKARGRDVALFPLYSPIRVDEEDVSEPRVLFGGINVYLQHAAPLAARLTAGVSGLLDHPRLLRAALRRAGSGGSPQQFGSLAVSVLRGLEGDQRREVRKLVDGLRPFAPNVVHLPNAMFLGLARPLREGLNAAIVCTLTGEDIFVERLSEEHRDACLRLIRAAAGEAHAYICVSRAYVEYAVERLGVAAERLHVVPLGVSVTDAAAPAEPSERPFVIGYLARICPDKGLHLLCEAFVRLRREGRDARLAIAGYLGAGDRPYWESCRTVLSRGGVTERVDFRGEVDRAGKRAFLRSLHVLSVPTAYRDPKGLFVLEALAHGVPVVQPRHGAFPELIEATGGGVLHEPRDVGHLARELARMMDDGEHRRGLGARGREAVLREFTAERMAERTWAVFEGAANRAI
ncbi:MAG: glycosyltransferase family 4 protein [Phycisphaerae bacterium]|nr:glycosyltransferase family 4 protein [Phycisphaerae bacterium]NUQ46272.1 glycosyltransferase family 4 protein [Phycisphaerae bacterium]